MPLYTGLRNPVIPDRDGKRLSVGRVENILGRYGVARSGRQHGGPLRQGVLEERISFSQQHPINLQGVFPQTHGSVFRRGVLFDVAWGAVSGVPLTLRVPEHRVVSLRC